MRILIIKAFSRMLFLLLVMAALLFIPAGTLDYWQAWTFMAVYFTSYLAITVYLIRYDPKLLERRINGGPTAEKELAQRIITIIAASCIRRPHCPPGTRSPIHVVSRAAVAGARGRRARGTRLARILPRIQRKFVHVRHH